MTEEEARTYVATVAPALGLLPPAADPDAVAQHVAIAFRLAALFLQLPVEDDDQPAPVYDPFGPAP